MGGALLLRKPLNTIQCPLKIPPRKVLFDTLFQPFFCLIIRGFKEFLDVNAKGDKLPRTPLTLFLILLRLLLLKHRLELSDPFEPLFLLS